MCFFSNPTCLTRGLMLRPTFFVIGLLLVGFIAVWSIAHAPVQSLAALSVEQRGL